MKVYFIATSRDNRLRSIYKRVVDWLESEGHEVFEKVMSSGLPPVNEVSSHQVKEWYREWMVYMNDCDLVVVEGSYPSSIHIGFEVGVSLMKGKPTVLLYQKKKSRCLSTRCFLVG